MRKLSYKKLFAIAALAALVLVLLPIAGSAPSSHAPFSISSFSPNVAFAQSDKPTDSFLSCISSPFSCTVTGISWLINKIISLFIILGATFASAILKLNGTLFDSPIVQVGFSITLAFANLGFVLAIIVIAIATILRNQTYGVKQLLWKLVLMAILVNFGLVITRPIVAVSDSMSNYFIQQMSGSTGDFVNNLTAAFSPQTLPSVEGTPQDGKSALATPNCKNFSSGWATFGCTLGSLALGPGFVYLTTPASSPDTFMQAVLSLVFSATFLAIVAFSLIALAILLLLRYLYITFLLILLPLAWLAWVFPGMKSHFDKWWHLFLRWTFFPAISFFFIYLAMLIAPGATTNSAGNQSASYISKSLGTTQILGNGLAGGVTLASSEAQGVGLAQQALTELVLCGLVLGGLYAANELGIAGAGVAMGYAKSAGGWVAGKAGGAAARQGKKAASAAVPQNVKNKLQQGGYRFLPKRLQVAAGIGLGNVQKAGGAALVSQESAWAKQHAENPEEAKRLLESGVLKQEKQIALLQELIRQGRVDNKTRVGKQTVAQYVDSNKGVLETRYGQTKLTGDIDKALGSDGKMRRDAEKLKLANKNGMPDEIAVAQTALDESSASFFSERGKGDISKMNVNGAFGKDAFNDNPELARAQLKAIADKQAQLLPSILAKASGKTIGNITTEYENFMKPAVERELAKEKGEVELRYASDDGIATIRASYTTKSDKATADLKDALQSVRLSGIGNPTAAQQAYDDTMKNLKEKQDVEERDYLNSLQKKKGQEIEGLNGDEHRDEIKKRLGGKFYKTLGNNTFGIAPEEKGGAEEKPVEPKAGAKT